MHLTADIEALLQPMALGSLQEWKRVKDFLAASFSQYLGQGLTPVWEPFYEDISCTSEDRSPSDGLAFGFRSAQALGGPLALEFYGVIELHSNGIVDAVVLLFSNNQRLERTDYQHKQHQQFMHFKFAAKENNSREWQFQNWGNGEAGEWEENYQNLSELCGWMSKLPNG